MEKENEWESREAKHLEGLGAEQLITLPMKEVAKAQMELCESDLQKMQQSFAGSVPRDKKKEP